MRKFRTVTAILVVLALVMAFLTPCVLADETDGTEETGDVSEDVSAEESEDAGDSQAEEPSEESFEESSEEPSEESSEEVSEAEKEKYAVTIKEISGGKYSISDNYVGESHDKLSGVSSYTFFEGDEVTVVFTPNSGKTLKSVKLGSEELTFSGNTVSFTVTGDVTVNYEFAAASAYHVTLTTHFLCESSGFSFFLNGESLAGTMLGKYFKLYSGESAVFSVANDTYPDFMIRQAEIRENGNVTPCEINGKEVVIPPISDNAVFFIELSDPFFSVKLVQTEHGTVSCSNTTCDENENVTFTFTPDEGYRAKYIVINNNAIPVTGNSYVAVAISDMTVSVVFGEDDNEMLVSLELEKDEEGVSHGSAAFEGTTGESISVIQGDVVTVVFSADTGYELDSAKVNGISYPVDAEGKLKVAITRDTVISVSFKVLQPRITAVVTNAGGGSITAVGKTITMNYVYVNYGESITFKFAPDMNYSISFVKVDMNTVYNASDGGSPMTSYTFDNVTENHTIAVSFAREGQLLTEFTITSTAAEHGTVTPLGEQKVVQGESISYKVTPDEGYEVDYVTVDGKDVSLRNGVYTFDSVSADHIISAYFKEKSKTDSTLVTVDDIDWTSSVIAVDLTKKTELESKVIEKLCTECVGRTAVFRTNTYEVSFVVPANLSADQLRLDLASARDAECANYLTVSTIIQSKAQYSSSVFAMINLNKFFPSGAVAKVLLGSEFAGKKLSYLTYEAGELVPSTSSAIVCGSDGWAEVTLKKFKDLVFIADKDEAVSFKVTILDPANGTVEPSGTFTVNNGEKVQFTVKPDDGYTISKILVNGEPVTISGTKYSITPVEDTEIDVRFALVKEEEGSSKAGLIICIVIIVVALIGGAVLFVTKWKQTKY